MRNSLFVLLVLGALSVDPVRCLLESGLGFPPSTAGSSSTSSSLSSSSFSSSFVVKSGEEERAAADGAPPPVIHGLPPDERAPSEDMAPTQSGETLVDPETVVDPDNGAYDFANDTDDAEPPESDDSSSPESVVVVVNLVGWSLAVVAALCLFYAAVRFSRRASAWAWGSAREFPQPFWFFGETPTSASKLQLLQLSESCAPSVIVYTPQPLFDLDSSQHQSGAAAGYQKLAVDV